MIEYSVRCSVSREVRSGVMRQHAFFACCVEIERLCQVVHDVQIHYSSLCERSSGPMLSCNTFQSRFRIGLTGSRENQRDHGCKGRCSCSL